MRRRAVKVPVARLMTALRCLTAVVILVTMRNIHFILTGGISDFELSLQAEPEKVLIFTWLFGEMKSNTRHLQLFIESARGCGVDVAIVGSPEPNWRSPLPPNVFHIPVTWDELTDRVKFRVFDGVEPGKLRQNPESKYGYYKINDFKPLFGYLFPEHVKEYQFWGYVDNDVLLGNIRRFLAPERLAVSDIISAVPKQDQSLIFGGFTLYRNIPKTNELFRLAKRPPEEIFAVQKTQYFDEAGGKNEGDGSGLESSIQGIMNEFGERLGIRFTGIVRRTVWDGVCLGDSNLGPCFGCELSHRQVDGQQVLKEVWSRRKRTHKNEIILCHFQHTKKLMEKYLESEALMNDLLKVGRFRYDIHGGFFRVNGARFPHQVPVLTVPRSPAEARSKEFWKNVTGD